MRPSSVVWPKSVRPRRSAWPSCAKPSWHRPLLLTAEAGVGAVVRQELGRLKRLAEPARRGITNVLKTWAWELKAAGGKGVLVNAEGCPVPLLPPTTTTSQLAVAALLAVSRALTACDKAKLRQRGRVVAAERYTCIHALAFFIGHHASVGLRDEWSLVPFSFIGETFDLAAAAFIAHICHPMPFRLRRYGQLPRCIVEILKLASNVCQQSLATNELLPEQRPQGEDGPLGCGTA